MTMYWIAYKSLNPVFEGTLIIGLYTTLSTNEGFVEVEYVLRKLLNNDSIHITAWRDLHDKGFERTQLIQKIARELYTCWAATLADTIVFESITDIHGFRYIPDQVCDELLKEIALDFDQQPQNVKDRFIKHAQSIASDL